MSVRDPNRSLFGFDALFPEMVSRLSLTVGTSVVIELWLICM